MGGETYKINESGKGATASLSFRFLRLFFILSIISLPLFYAKLGMDNYPIALIVIAVISIILYITKKEADTLHLENGKVTVKGKKFFIVPFKSTADYPKVKYKFNKPNDKKKPLLLRKTPLLTLYKDGSKWAEFHGNALGWSKPKLGEIVKTLISKGCYNWFEFNKKSRRKKRSS